MTLSTKSPDPTGIIEEFAPAQTRLLSDSEKLLISTFNKYLLNAQLGKQVYRNKWAYYKCMMEGNQILVYNPDTHEYFRLSGSEVSKRKYSVDNMLMEAGREAFGNRMQRSHKFVVAPSSDSSDKIHESMIYDAFIQYHDQRNEMDTIRAKEMWHHLYAGNSFRELMWDPLGGRRFAWCEDCSYKSYEPSLISMPCPDCQAKKQSAEQEQAQIMQTHEAMQQASPEAYAASGAQAPTFEPIDQAPLLKETFEGESKPRFHKAIDIDIDNNCVDMKDAQWAIITCVEPVTSLRRRCPEYADTIKASTGLNIDEFGISNYDYDSKQVSANFAEDYARWYLWMQMPTETYPKGFVMWVSNDQPVYFNDDVLFAEFGRLPIFHTTWKPKFPENFWGTSFVEEALPQQKQLNENDTVKREWVESVAKYRMAFTVGSISPNQITDRTMQMIPVKQGFQTPTMIPPPNLPQEVFMRSQELRNNIRNKAMTAGTAVGTDTSGRSVALQQSNREVVEAALETANLSEIKAYYKCLLIQETNFRSYDWQFAVSGDLGVEVFSLPPKHFSGDITIEMNDGLPENPEARRNFVMEQVAQGWFTNPQTGVPDISAAARAARIKLPHILPDNVSVQVNAAQAMCRDIEAGNLQAMLTGSDDVKIFATVFQNWLNTKGRKPDINLDVKMVVDNLYTFCRQTILQAEMAAQMQAQAAGGAPPTAGGPAGSVAGSKVSSGSPTAQRTQNAQAAGGSGQQSGAGQMMGAADRAGEGMARGNKVHEH